MHIRKSQERKAQKSAATSSVVQEGIAMEAMSTEVKKSMISAEEQGEDGCRALNGESRAVVQVNSQLSLS